LVLFQRYGLQGDSVGLLLVSSAANTVAIEAKMLNPRLILRAGLWSVSCAVVVSTAMASAEWTQSVAGSSQSSAPSTAKTWTASRTPAGQPDLQGIWVDNTITPFERPPDFKGRAVLTDDELATLKARAARLFDGSGDTAIGDELFMTLLRNPQEHRLRGTGDYNLSWVNVELVFENRTSQIIDPPDGLLPALTAEGRRRTEAAAEAARSQPADGPESRAPSERCLTVGTARVGFLSARNNSLHQIVQTADYVMIHSEMVHEARIIPLAQRPHLSPAVRFWSGDSRGRWEGQTLVIDTTNFTTELIFRQRRGLAVSGENVHLTERLTPLAADFIEYAVTVDDPTTWTRPWTAVTTWKRSGDRMFEFACHEANYSLVNILRGARAEERQPNGQLRRDER
jgi:hypothetical protein